MGSRSQELPIFVHYCINGKTVLYLPIYDFNVGKYVDIDTVKSVKFLKYTEVVTICPTWRG